MPEIIDPVFAKTSWKRSFSMTENERFGLVFVKTGAINSGTGLRYTVQYIKHRCVVRKYVPQNGNPQIGWLNIILICGPSQMWQYSDFRFADYIFFAFCGPNCYLLTKNLYLTNISLKCSHLNLRATFGFRNSYMALRSLKYCYVGKENIRDKPIRIWIRNTACFLANLQICDLRNRTPRKFADLWFSD